MLDYIKRLIATLDTIEVRGKENLDRLLGCIQLLEKIKTTIEEAAKDENQDGTRNVGNGLD